jgi:hypothetical protein
MVVVFLAILMLTGPVLHHRKVVGERGRVLVFVDASQSMKLTDEPMEVSRKLLAARRLGGCRRRRSTRSWRSRPTRWCARAAPRAARTPIRPVARGRARSPRRRSRPSRCSRA